MVKQYPIAPAPNGIFESWQGEGHLRGFRQTFIRLAGCSVGCDECDTDYTKERMMSAEQIAAEAWEKTNDRLRDRWVWITGGEPTDHDLSELLTALKKRRFSICLATSGSERFAPPVDWLSVSPHDLNTKQLYGNEIKLIDGLNGLNLDEWVEEHPDHQTDFWYRYAQPLASLGKECPESLKRCLAFVKANPNWSLSRQDHIVWGNP